MATRYYSSTSNNCSYSCVGQYEILGVSQGKLVGASVENLIAMTQQWSSEDEENRLKILEMVILLEEVRDIFNKIH